ncbi:MAG: hypothetical protein KatS3mg087_1867 [Patescibacteria group bacterium]|nr:MAG: hypothetical protein KatS3mg087_1867 [Patescibacteria group bacterium]
MNSKNVFYLMAGAVVLAGISIVLAVVLGTKILEKQSEKLVELKVENQVLESQQTGLVKAKNDIAKYSNLEEITQSIVPRDKDQAKAVLEVVTLARQSGISIKSVTFPNSTLGTRQQPQTQEEEAPAPQPTAPITQAKPVEGIPGVYALEMNIVPEGRVSYYQFIDFLSKLEKNRRTSQVTGIKIDPLSSERENPQISFSLTFNIFLKP